MRSEEFLRIQTVFDSASDPAHKLLYTTSIRSVLQRLMSRQKLEEDGRNLYERLPYFTWSEWGNKPTKFSLFLLGIHTSHGAKFFYDLISRWLLPGRKLDTPLFFATDFELPEVGDQRLKLIEMVIAVENEGEVEMIRRYLPILEAEICLGVSSPIHASRILEVRGLSSDEKTSLIQEKIVSLMKKKPEHFDSDIFDEMQHFLVICKEEFKAERSCNQLCRIISLLYLFLSRLKREKEKTPEKRHISLKLLRTSLSLPFGTKRVLSLFVGMTFLNEHELFEERHLLQACREVVSDVQAVEGSYFFRTLKEEKIGAFYLEIEKREGEISPAEIEQLRQALLQGLKNGVQQRMHTLFMPRNEEEVMRNIVTLSHQVNHFRDLPHLILSFDEQTESELSFTVILVRVKKEEDAPLKEILSRMPNKLKLSLDRIKVLGKVSNRYVKEAAVIRIALSKEPFLREDHSIDLYKARQELVLILKETFGELRDYNGGMIAKQIELFSALSQRLGPLAKRHAFLLENFFHSLYPVEWRSMADPKPLSSLFLLLLKMMEKEESIVFQKESEALFVLAAIEEGSLKQKIFNAVQALRLASAHLLVLHLQLSETLYLGYIYFSEDENAKLEFLKAVQKESCAMEFIS